MLGEYKTILQLVGVLSHGKMAKRLTDQAIDLMQDVQNLRKAIYEYVIPTPAKFALTSLGSLAATSSRSTPPRRAAPSSGNCSISASTTCAYYKRVCFRSPRSRGCSLTMAKVSLWSPDCLRQLPHRDERARGGGNVFPRLASQTPRDHEASQ